MTTSEPDKMCSVGVAYIKFYKLTGEEKYLQAARGIAKTIASHVAEGDAKTSPLPFRVNLKDGKVLDPYTSHMVSAVLLFDELIRLGESGRRRVPGQARSALEMGPEVSGQQQRMGRATTKTWPQAHTNKNQQSPMETARFMLRHPEMDPDYKQHVPALLAWVKDRFGKTKRYGATSIREQDICPPEMSSHTVALCLGGGQVVRGDAGPAGPGGSAGVVRLGHLFGL